MLYGARVMVKVLNTHHCRSPLVQGGLEIPVQVIVKIDYSPQNKDAIFKYESLVEQYYKEPVDSKFENITATVLDGLESDADKETDEAEEYEPEARPEHNETEHDGSAVLTQWYSWSIQSHGCYVQEYKICVVQNRKHFDC